MDFPIDSKVPSRHPMPWRLRELGDEDKSRMLAFFLGLNKDDRNARFHFNVSDQVLFNYVQKIDFKTCTAVGAFLDGELLGIAELYIEPSQEGRGIEEGELAIALTGSLRGSGISAVMMDFLKKKAASLGLVRIHLAFIPSNIPMRKVAAKIGMFETGSFDHRIAQASL